MKRKLAILLAAAMTVSMLPVNAMAASSNTVNKTVTVADDDEITGIYLKIQPNDEIESGESIAITIENAEFDEDEVEVAVPYEQNGYTYASAMASYADAALGEYTTLAALFNNNKGNKLPYKIIVNSKKEIEVKLFPISDSYAGKDWDVSGAVKEKPYYYIPINAVAKGNGDVKIKIDANETSISGGGTYTIATVTSSSGSTTTTVSDTDNFDDELLVETITVKEDVKGTFDTSKNSGKIRLRTNSGFKFDDSSKNWDFEVAPGTNSTFSTVTDYELSDSGDELTFYLPTEMNDTEKASAIKISGLVIIPEDDDDDYGDVNITISGCNMTKETILVGTRADYGFKITVLEDPTTIYAGRFENGDDTNNDYSENGTNYIDEDDCVAAEIKFEETIANTWVTQRNLDFTVPEGVKIYDYDFSDDKYINDKLEEFAVITNDGRTLRIKKGIDLNDNDCSEFQMKLYLSADAAYAGDVTLAVSGAGMGDEIATDEVIAKVVTPVTIETSKTEANIGYQNYNTADIVITEAEAGIFLKGGKVAISLDAPFGNSEVGFSDLDSTEIVVDGDLEIKNFKFTTYDSQDGVITFDIDKRSNAAPATITIKNVCVGTTRSVPYGSYDLKLGGNAVICNYSEDAVDDISYPVSNESSSEDQQALGYFDTNDSYSFKDYLVIKTAPGTLDDVVEVTIDEKTILLNGQSYDMDVAPYIQASSNSTMVPLRFVAVALGVDPDSISNPDESSKVNWDANSKTVTIFYGAGSSQKIVQFTAGSNIMTVDGSAINMEYGVYAEIKDDRMFVPFRALGQALGVNVTWNADTRTATYNG